MIVDSSPKIGEKLFFIPPLVCGQALYLEATCLAPRYKGSLFEFVFEGIPLGADTCRRFILFFEQGSREPIEAVDFVKSRWQLRIVA